MMSEDIRILLLPEVKKVTGLGGSTLYSMISRGEFPEPLHIGTRRSGWRSDEIQEWILSLPTGTREYSAVKKK